MMQKSSFSNDIIYLRETENCSAVSEILQVAAAD